MYLGLWLWEPLMMEANEKVYIQRFLPAGGFFQIWMLGS